MEQGAELRLAEHAGQLVVGAEVGGGERRERRRIELRRFARPWPPSARCDPRSAPSARSTRRGSRSGSPGCAGSRPPETTSSTHRSSPQPHARVASRPRRMASRAAGAAPAGAPRRDSRAAGGWCRRRPGPPGSRARPAAGAGRGLNRSRRCVASRRWASIQPATPPAARPPANSAARERISATSCRATSAWARVTPSTYSRSPPIGQPARQSGDPDVRDPRAAAGCRWR